VFSEEVNTMAKDDRDILAILKFELDFLENGGYGRSVRTPWKETSIFQDSLSCINFGDPERSRPCDECLLMAFVPNDQRSSSVPCHHIPLTERGETIEVIEQGKSRVEVEEALKIWLRKTIHQIEVERTRPTTH
jgi:hypothetical protein